MSIPDPLIGSQLGDYKIIDLLGRGGMARVYRGYDENLDRYAAVKVIDPVVASAESNEEYRQRFLREARAVARLRHPNIVGIYQFGEYENLYYMAMVFIDGRDLGQILKEGQSLPWDQVLRIVHDIAGALDYAHAGGVIHRDVKPSNIVVTKDGQAILTDFGLALSVPEGTLGNTFGSVHYIAPEQAVSSASAVPQSDFYSLGVVLYQMLTGRVPFDDTSAMSVALMHLNDAPPSMRQLNPAISAEVEAVVFKALEKEPENRFRNGEAMVRALEQALGISTISESRLPPLPLAEHADVEPIIGKTSSTIVFPPSEPNASEPLRQAASEAASSQERERGKQRTLLIGTGMLLILALTLLVWAAVGANGDGDSATPTSVRIAQLETAVPDEPDNLVGAGMTEEATVTRTASPVPTRTSTREVSTAAAATEKVESSPTAAPASSTQPPAEAEVTSTVENAQDVSIVTLVYDDQSFTLVNNSDDNVDVSGLTFVQSTPGGSQLSFRSDQWANGTRPVWSLSPGDCFQVWRLNLPELPVPGYCDRRQAWRAVAAQRWFWLSGDAEATFEVLRGDDVLATCAVNEGICEVVLNESAS